MNIFIFDPVLLDISYTTICIEEEIISVISFIGIFLVGLEI